MTLALILALACAVAWALWERNRHEKMRRLYLALRLTVLMRLRRQPRDARGRFVAVKGAEHAPASTNGWRRWVIDPEGPIVTPGGD